MGSDPIVALCARFHAIQAVFDSEHEHYKAVMARVDAAMPLPDPLIVHGPASEALRIKASDPEFPLPVHNVIKPREIETALFYLQPVKMKLTEEVLPDGKIARTFVDLDEPEPLNEAPQAEHDMLTRMLEMSKEYRAEHDRRAKESLGPDYDDNDDTNYARCDEQRKIAVGRTRARGVDGLLAKINLYRSDPEFLEELVDSIFEDVESLMGKLA